MNRALRVIGGLAVAAVAFGTAAAIYVLFFGGYDVAATEEHLAPTIWVLNQSMLSSVRERSDDVEVPALDDARRIDAGAGLFREHCETCHGGPGIAPRPFALGLVPLPNNLANTARTWRPQTLFWTVKHGIKMTGMPAWDHRLSDDEIWSVVAFLPRMARMTPPEYAALPRTAPERVESPTPVQPPDPARGRRALHQFGCPTCHFIPGVAAPGAPVGPPLDGMARRSFIAGVLPNTPANLVRWLRGPQEVDPRSAMPDLGLSEQDAADVAAYLETLD